MFVLGEMRMIEAVRAAITEEMERDERVLVMGEDVGRKGGVFGATEASTPGLASRGCWTRRWPSRRSSASPSAPP